jgi:hypothetical protein
LGCSGEGQLPERADGAAQLLKGGSETCITLVAAKDTTISRAEARKAFGTKKVLRVSDELESLLGFDLASIPKGAVLKSATLKLYAADADCAEPLDLHRVTAAWSEASTYFSFQQRFERQPSGGLLVRHGKLQKSVDLTALTSKWLSGSVPNFGVLLDGDRRRDVTFVSREGDVAGERPSLSVCYQPVADACASKPCKNGGACGNTLQGFSCDCAPGYNGKRCEDPIDHCSDEPCQNGGSCQQQHHGCTCACPPGFGGPNCEVDLDRCAKAPCKNGGTCVDGPASYSCVCPADYEGNNCETPRNHCAADTCQHGGTCTSSATGYTCQCPLGFSGANCEVNVDDCTPSACANGGTCIDRVASYSCACPPDWGGTRCELNLNLCSQVPCLNGSSCVNAPGSYSCVCAAGYTGNNCEVDINDCTPTSCANGGLCVDKVAGFSCNCLPGYPGATCNPECQSPTCGPAAFQIEPSLEHDFGSLVVGTVASFDFQLRNVGDLEAKPIIVLGGMNADVFALTGCTAPLSPGASCTLTARFRPLTTSQASSFFTVSGGATTESVQLRGTGANPAVLSLSPSAPMDLGVTRVGAESPLGITFTVSNALGQAASGPIAVSLTNAAEFSIRDNTCLALEPNTYCGFRVVFAPTGRGPTSTQVVVTWNDKQVLGLVNGLGACAPGMTGDQCQLDVDYCSPNPCQNGAACVDGTLDYACFCPAGTTGKNCEVFDCASAPDGSPCNDGNACTHADSCVSQVCVGSEPVSCAAADACHDPGTCNPSNGQCTNPLKASCAPATLAASPTTSRDFGTIAFDTVSQSFSFNIRNAGDIATSPVSVLLTGADPNQFRLTTTCGPALAPGGVCNVDTVFAPVNPGVKFAIVFLSIGGAQPLVLNLSGTAAPPAVLSLTPSVAIDTGFTPVGGTSTAVNWIISNGSGQAQTGPLNITLSDTINFAFSPSSFGPPICVPSVTVLKGGESCALQVVHTPKSTGAHETALTVQALPGGAQVRRVVGTGT